MSEIIIVTSHRVYDTLGGVEKFVESFSSWCDNKGINVTVISRVLAIRPVRITYGPIPVHEADKIQSVKKVQLPFQLYYLGLFLFSLSTFFALLRLNKKARLHDRSLVIHSQDINFAALATVLVGKLMRIPTVIHQHGPYQKLLPSKNMEIIEESINKFTCNLSDIIITTDKFSQEYLLRLIPKPKKLCVIPAAVNTKLFDIPIGKHINNNNCFRIGYIGRLSEEKNIATLLYAFEEYKHSTCLPCKLILVGDGSLRVKLQQLALKLKISDYVEFTGFERNVIPILSTFDVFVLPSKIEGTPICLIEAMCAGKAIIASNIPPIREIVKNEEDALLFEADNYSQLKQKIQDLSNNLELRKKLGINAKNKSKQYDIEIVYSKILQRYQRAR